MACIGIIVLALFLPWHPDDETWHFRSPRYRGDLPNKAIPEIPLAPQVFSFSNHSSLFGGGVSTPLKNMIVKMGDFLPQNRGPGEN